MNTYFEMMAVQAGANNVSDPDASVRSVVKSSLGIQLPATRRLSLYHVRGVSNAKYIGGEDKDFVIFEPEFLYVLDVGFPASCGLVVPWKNSSAGDPHFPDFKQATLRSVQGTSREQLLFPSIPSDLLVGVKQGTAEATVRADLAQFCSSVVLSSTDLYLVKVKPFHESQIAAQIEATVPYVKYASLNGIVRLIDFAPGWFVDQVA